MLTPNITSVTIMFSSPSSGVKHRLSPGVFSDEQLNAIAQVFCERGSTIAHLVLLIRALRYWRAHCPVERDPKNLVPACQRSLVWEKVISTSLHSALTEVGAIDERDRLDLENLSDSPVQQSSAQTWSFGQK